MNDPGRMYMPQWTSSSILKGCLKDHPAMKLMEMVAKRDAAFAERDMAMAEKKTACAQRDAALLQRDLAYADRNAVWMERDAMLAALAMIRMGKENREAAAMLMQMFNGIPALFMDANSQMVPEGAAAQFENYWKHSEVRSITAGAQVEDPLPQSKRKRKQRTLQDVMAELENTCKRNAIKKIFEAETPLCPSASPSPYCSCTGSNQQCYKWGKGGWQSACCTNFLSMYPLPMSTTRQSSRVPGRKMSGGAFAKLLDRLATEGVDISVPIDLKRHWAKHGTNRYIIIK